MFAIFFSALTIPKIAGDSGQWTNRTGLNLYTSRSQAILTNCSFRYTIREIGSKAITDKITIENGHGYAHRFIEFYRYFSFSFLFVYSLTSNSRIGKDDIGFTDTLKPQGGPLTVFLAMYDDYKLRFDVTIDWEVLDECSLKEPTTTVAGLLERHYVSGRRSDYKSSDNKQRNRGYCNHENVCGRLV